MATTLQKNTVGSTEKISPVYKFARNNMTQLVTVGVLILLSLLVSLLNENFLTPSNLINVVLQCSTIAVLAVGMSFVIFSDGIDLSVGSVMALCCTICGDLVVNRGVNVVLSVLLTFGVGAFCGLSHGLLITKIKMPPFIVTMGGMMLWRGVALEWVDGVGIYGVPDSIGWLGSAYIGGENGVIPYANAMLVVLFFVAWFILRKTKFGTHVYAIGDNAKAAKLSGIKVDKMRIIIYTVSGLACALAAIVAAGRMDGSTPTVGQGYELEAIAGVAIGGASMSGGVGSIWGTLIGVLMVQVIRNGMNMIGLSAYYQQIVIGSIIIVAVGIDCFRRRKSN